MNEVQDIADVAQEISVGGDAMKLAPLRPVDIADAARHLISTRRSDFMQGIRMANLPPTVIAESLSKIQCTSVTLSDLLTDWEGMMKLLHLSLVRGGTQITFQKVRNDLDPTDHSRLLELVCAISSLELGQPESNGKADPTLATSMTGT